jgi:TIR domain/Pentapeptide repeats (8 copies)
MANQEHLAILKQGVEVWNKWRMGSPKPNIHNWYDDEAENAKIVIPDLSKLDIETDLDMFDLSSIDFNHVNLSEANLSHANLYRTNFYGADLRSTKLINASLYLADLRAADLRGADLRGADLFETNLSDTDLRKANLKGATTVATIFNGVNLSDVKGLKEIYHDGPSAIGIDTIIYSQGSIPRVFLQGAGVPETIIESIPYLISAMKPIDYYSCFISYSSKDQAFTEKLHSDLLANGVRCWFAPKDLKVGDKFWHRIDESIRLYDKLLVVLSKNSVASTWVENEVMTALEQENKQNKTVLFPIKLDDSVMDTNAPWAANIRRVRHIGDFTKWRRQECYQKSFDRLLHDLKIGE